MRAPKVGADSIESGNRPRSKPLHTMKVVRRNARGETRELLLKEYFLNAYLIAVLKKVGDQVARHTRREPELKPVRVRAGS